MMYHGKQASLNWSFGFGWTDQHHHTVKNMVSEFLFVAPATSSEVNYLTNPTVSFNRLLIVLLSSFGLINVPGSVGLRRSCCSQLSRSVSSSRQQFRLRALQSLRQAGGLT
jgi:hypothetical protein